MDKMCLRVRPPRLLSPSRGVRRCLIVLVTVTGTPVLANEAEAIRPFTIEVDDATLDDLQCRLAQTRWRGWNGTRGRR